MGTASHRRLQHVVYYDAYVVFTWDDGSYVAETVDEGDDLRIKSRDLEELLAALDQIEEALDSLPSDAPAWLVAYKANPGSSITLPSALEKPTTETEPEIIQECRHDPTRVFLSGVFRPDVILRALERNTLWRLMPSHLARRFPDHDRPFFVRGSFAKHTIVAGSYK